MSTINLYLERPDRKNNCKVSIVYLSKGKRLKTSTGISVAKKSWDEKNQKVKPAYTGAVEINSLLEEKKEGIKGLEREVMFQKKEITVDVIKTKLGEVNKGFKGNDFFSVYDKYVEMKKKIVAASTLRRMNAAKIRLTDFAEEGLHPVNFDSINNDFYAKYIAYLSGKELVNNSIGSHIKTIITFMRYASEAGYNKNSDYKTFKVFQEEGEQICLTEDELMTLLNMKLKGKRLESVRDNFCFACFTGVRFSDLSAIKKENIQKDFLHIKTEKTRHILKVPLNKYAKAILEKYDYQLPAAISNQKMNLYIKELCKDAKIKSNVHTTHYSLTKKIDLIVPKHQAVSTHTARRTFVTLALEKGLRPEIVMEITGHKSYSSFQKYIKLTDKVIFNEFNRIW